MRNESKPSGWSVLLLVLLLAAVVLLLIGLRTRTFDPWLNATFPHLYPALLGLMGVAIAVKMMLRPSSRDVERGFRWFWVVLLLIAAVMSLGKALG
jgi:small neutral amino acid transporter SnatA (MarC family)